MTGFKTKRLRVSPWDNWLDDPDRRLALSQTLKAMLTEPVLRHLPPGLTPEGTPDAMAHWIAARQAAGQVLLIQRQDDVIGLLFLFRGKGAALNIGYLLSEAAWGRGFASELVAGVVASLQNGPQTTLQGGVARGNPASARVLEKAGFQRDPAQSTDALTIYVKTVGSDQ